MDLARKIDCRSPRCSLSLYVSLSLSLSLPRVPLDLSPVHGHNQHRNAGIARRAATFPAGTTRWGDVPGCCWQVECSTSPQRTRELLVRRDVLEREKETSRRWCVCCTVREGGDEEIHLEGMPREEGPRDSDDSTCDFECIRSPALRFRGFAERTFRTSVPVPGNFNFFS